tara:strand:- start:42 stop:554 length:513 start_codon:yes stop_codon:yes gene_type:complete
MKITNEQLKQIIKEELDKVFEAYRPHHSIRPPEFDSRTEKNYPEHQDKLRNLYMSDEGREQARELAQGLRYDDKLPDDEQVVEPIDIPVDASRTEDDLTLPIFDKSKDYSFGSRYTDDGIEIHFFWNPRQKQYVISYQIPYGYPGGGGGQGGFLNYDSYEEAAKAYMMKN